MLKISTSVVELDSSDDFCVGRDIVFINDFLFCISLCVLKSSSSAVEQGFGGDFWVCSDFVFVKDL